MTTQIKLFNKEDKAKYFFKELSAELFCVDNQFVPTYSEENVVALDSTKTEPQFSLPALLGNFVFMLIGFASYRRLANYKEV